MGYMRIDATPEAKYLCDTLEDLSVLLPRPGYGDTCWVISEACEYIYNSKGKWLPKNKTSVGSDTKVDLTGYATEDFVQEQIQNIQHPVVEVPSKLSELENDANYVQQDYVDNKVADLVNSAPETLDTIGEIAQALKDHQDVADAITEAIGKKADKEDLPSVEGLASEAFVTEAIQKIEFPVTDLSNYYTRDEVTQAIADSAELPEGGLAHQYLAIDANGNKTWETQTHYLEERIVTNVEETTGTGRYIPYYVTHGLKLGKEYTIFHNGVEYKCTSVEYSGDVILGNLGMGGIPGATDTGEPFVFLGSKTDNVYVQYAIFKDNIEHTFSIKGPSDIATQLSDKFIPPTVPKTTFGNAGDTVVITEVHHGAPVKWAATKLPKKLSDLENDIKFIDQEYVDTKVAELVDNAPETLNTLKEVADALNENASTAEALNQAIGNKVDKTDYPIESNPNQWLTTDTEGNKVWEDKTHYKSLVAAQLVLEETTFTSKMVQANMGLTSVPFNHGASEWGQLVDVVYDGVTYHCVAKEYTATPGAICVGNTSIGLKDSENTGEPFLWVRLYPTASSSYMYTAESAATEHTVSATLAEHYEYITLAEEYLPKNIPMLKEGSWGQTVMVSSNSSDGPKAYEAVGFGYLERIMFNDKSIYLNGSIDSIWHSVEYLTNLFIHEAKNLCLPMVERRIWMNSDSDYDMYRIFLKNYYTIEENNDVIVHLHFDERYPDIILKQSDKSITLDPNWVAPTVIPETTEPNQYLTTNENGEKVWEEKLTYYTKEEKLLIPEQTVDATSQFVLHSEFEAQTGDMCRVVLDDKTYTGTYHNANNGALAVIKMTEGEGFPVTQFFTNFSDFTLSMGTLGFSGTLTVYVTTDVIRPIKTQYLGVSATAGNGIYATKIGNLSVLEAEGASAIALNEGKALMAGALGINQGTARGWFSFAQGTGEAKDMCSSAFGVGTVSSGYAQMVSGKNNLEDLNDDYAVIIGNGESGWDENDDYYVNHANAYTLDWEGNARYAGDVYIQGTDVDNLQDAKKVATEEYVNSLVQNKADSADVVQANWEENNSDSNAYVMNRPFYDSRTNVVEWDGETSDTIVTIPEMNVTLYRVSDTPLTKDELGTVTYYSFGNEKGYTNLNSDLYVSSDEKIISESQTYSFVSVLEDGVTLHIGNNVEDVTFEKKGIYFWELKFSATLGIKTQKIKYGAVTQIPDYYISDRIARQDIVEWMDYNTPKTLNIYAADLDKDIITEVRSNDYVAGSGRNYTNNLGDAFDYAALKQYLKYATNKTNVGISWQASETVVEKRQALDLHLGDDGIGFHFIKDITFDEATGQPQFNLKKVWVANPNYVAE